MRSRNMSTDIRGYIRSRYSLLPPRLYTSSKRVIKTDAFSFRCVRISTVCNACPPMPSREGRSKKKKKKERGSDSFQNRRLSVKYGARRQKTGNYWAAFPPEHGTRASWNLHWTRAARRRRWRVLNFTVIGPCAATNIYLISNDTIMTWRRFV